MSFAGAPASITVDTGAGRVTGELGAVMGPVALTAGMGGIELTLPADANAELLAESGLGSVEALIDGSRLSARRGDPLRAELGEGGPRVSLVTGTGSIRVKTSAPPN